MLDKLAAINDRYLEVERLISSSDITNDMKLFVKLSKEYKDLEPIIKIYKDYRNLLGNIANAKEIISNTDDLEMKEMAKMELEQNLPKKVEMDEKIKVLLIPKDPADSKNAVMEIEQEQEVMKHQFRRGDLYRMYTAFAQSKGWKIELVDFADRTTEGIRK